MQCPYCGSPMFYVGVQDGGGDYGSSVCDEYACPECDYAVEVNCVEIEDEDFGEPDEVIHFPYDDEE